MIIMLTQIVMKNQSVLKLKSPKRMSHKRTIKCEKKPKCTKCDVIDKVLQNGSGNLDMRIIMNGIGL